MKINESEVSSGNASGKAGVPSIPFNKGYLSSGGNNGAPGIEFQPSGEQSFKTYKTMKHSKKNIKKRMKHLKTFENWTTTSTDKNININYNKETPKLSDVVIDTIKFIEDNFDQISGGINNTRENQIEFKTNELRYNRIYINHEKRDAGIPIPYIHFYYRDVHNELCGYSHDITESDYDYLKNYFYKIYRIFRKKNQEKSVEEYKNALVEIEEKRIKMNSQKYNL